MIRDIQRYIAVNQNKYFLIILTLMLGVTSGVIFVTYTSASTIAQLLDYTTTYRSLVASGEISASSIMLSSVINNIACIAVTWVCGLSLALLPVIYINLLYKGFRLGFMLCFNVAAGGYYNMLANVALILPDLLLMLPIMTFMSINALNFIINSRHTPIKYNRDFPQYLLSGLTTAIVCVVASIAETLIIRAL